MAEVKTALADFYLLSEWAVEDGVITSPPTTDRQTKTVTVSGIPAGVPILGAVFEATFGSPLSGIAELTVNGQEITFGTRSITLQPTISGNGQYTLSFEFRANGDATLEDGPHSGAVEIGWAAVTVTYQAEEPPPEPEPPADPDADWGDGARPISVFAPDAERFNNNGLAILTPLEGKLRTVAGGACEITMKHPIDPDGKWRYLVPGAIIRAPVPAERVDNAFIGLDVDEYRVKNQSGAAMREKMEASEVIWYNGFDYMEAYLNHYGVGSRVSWDNKNWECIMWQPENPLRVANPNIARIWWKIIDRYTPGAAVLTRLEYGQELYFVADEGNGWYRMSTPQGIDGYVQSDDVEYLRHITPTQADERTIKDQLFRVKNVVIDTEQMELTVYAAHVSYDLAGILVQEVKLSKVSPSMALTRIRDGFMMSYRGQIATNLTTEQNGTYSGTLSGKNGIFALLDPDSGIVPTFNARFSRDNWDLFVLNRQAIDRGFRLRYGKNVRGINWRRSSENLVTRVVPVAKGEDGADLYLPEMYIDSDHIGDYPVIIMERLAVRGQVGKDDGTGTDTLWTTETLFEEMRAKARERFDVDHADVIYQEITVDFEQLGDTADFPWLRGLEQVLLYDLVRAEDERVGLWITLNVTELEWDIIRRKVTAIKISTAIDHGLQTVAGYNIGNGSIGAEKLSEGAISELMNLMTEG